MKKILILLSVVFTTLSYAQNNAVILAPNYTPDITGLGFVALPTSNPGNTPNNPLDGYDGDPATFAQNIQVDDAGQIMFFIIDGYIFGNRGQLIDIMSITSIFGSNPSSYVKGKEGEILIVPVPKKCNEFYIFSTIYDGGLSGVYPVFSKLHIEYDNFGNLLSGSGLELVQPPLSNFTDCSNNSTYLGDLIGSEYDGGNVIAHKELPNLAAVNISEDEYFVFVKNAREVFRLRVDENGVYYDNNFFRINDLFVGIYGVSVLKVSTQEMELIPMSNGNFRMGFVAQIVSATNVFGPPGITYKGVVIIDFDAQGNRILNSEKFARYALQNPPAPIEQIYIRGVEFSENGERLYVSHSTTSINTSTLDMFDLTVADPNTARTVISSSLAYEHSQIEASFGNTILIATQNGLARIESGNNPAFPFNFDPTFLNVGNNNVLTPNEPLHAVRLLQDQIDGFDYSSIESRTYATDYYRVSTNETWFPNGVGGSNPLIMGAGDNIYIKNELRIEAGATLNINNLNVFFAPTARVVIENGTGGQQGGRLIMNNTLFNNDDRCDIDSLWLGVEVWGNQNQKQNLSQGVLRMNDSRIENAWIGCLVSARTSYTQEANINPGDCNFVSDPSNPTDTIINEFIFDDARNGGIVITNNSTFYNNQRGVYFRPYLGPNNANNMSIFNNTSFLWEGFLKEDAELIQLAALEEVKGIRFKGCDFENMTPDIRIIFEQGLGIHALESQFHVSPKCNVPVNVGQPCPSETISSFKGLRIGIATSNANGLTFSCTESEFVNNQHGIRVYGTNNEKITKNEFQIRELTSYQTSGIVTSFSTGYIIQENNLTNYDNPFVSITDVESYGIVIRSSGPYTNMVYKNTFSNLKIGAQTERNNATTNGLVGLLWQCNDFISNIDEHDMTLMKGDIKFEQGSTTSNTSLLEFSRAAANNKFSLTNEGQVGDHDLFVDPSSSTYEYYHISAPRHTPDSHTQSGFSGVFVLPVVLEYFGNSILSDANTCPSKLGKKPISLFKQRIEAFEDVIEDNLDLLEDGAEEDLLEEIVEESPGEVKEELLEHSPYLSDEVLLAYIASNPPSGHLKQVMIANSPLSAQVLIALSNVNMPNGTANQIAAAQVGVSERDRLNSEISYLTSEKNLLYWEMVSQLLLDEEEDADFEELIDILEDEDEDISSLKLLYRIYILLKDEHEAEEVLEDLEDLGATPEFVEICTIQKELINKSSVCQGIESDPLIQSRLQTVRTNIADKRAGSNATCLLDIHGTPIVPAFLVESSAIMLGGNDQDEKETIDLSRSFEVSIYPNPSTGLVTFDFPDNEEGELKITVIDLTGKIMHTETWGETNGQQIDLSNLHKGLYLVKISIDNVVVETQSLKLQ
ncbi:MAG: T9SS type A sorting domain-containing protein [Fluviicola sp.]|nr:T9SS type A sorting domain-containing protein [Fluviicola sp.]